MRQLQWQLASTVIWQGAKSHLIAEHLLLILTTNWTSSNQWSWAVALLVTLNLAWQQGMRFLHRQVHTSACSSLKIAIWSSRLSADKSVLRTEWPRYGEVWKERSPWSCFACRWSHSYYASPPHRNHLLCRGVYSVRSTEVFSNSLRSPNTLFIDVSGWNGTYSNRTSQHLGHGDPRLYDCY